MHRAGRQDSGLSAFKVYIGVARWIGAGMTSDKITFKMMCIPPKHFVERVSESLRQRAKGRRLSHCGNQNLRQQALRALFSTTTISTV